MWNTACLTSIPLLRRPPRQWHIHIWACGYDKDAEECRRTVNCCVSFDDRSIESRLLLQPQYTNAETAQMHLGDCTKIYIFLHILWLKRENLSTNYKYAWDWLPLKKKWIYSTGTTLVSKSAQIRPNHLDIHFHTNQSKKISSRITSANVPQLSHQCAEQLFGVAGICGLFHY